MNSFIKLDNGIVLNISQIETFGPIWPFDLLEFDDSQPIGDNIGDSVKRLFQDKEHNNIAKEMVRTSFATPLNCNDNMRKYGEGKILNYTVLLKSGHKFFITEAEYNNILEVMNLSANNVYSNVDKKYTKFDF